MSLLFSLFNVGDCVLMNSTQERGWIIHKHQFNTDDEYVKIDVRMQLDNKIVKNISSRDITVVPYEDILDEDNNRPVTRSNIDLGLNDDLNSDRNSNVVMNETETKRNELFQAIQNCFSWKTYNADNHLYKYLQDGMSLPRGWIRSIIETKSDDANDDNTDNDNTNKTHLSQHQNMILTTISCLFSGYSKNKGITKDHHKMTQHAFGVKNSTHAKIVKRFVSTEGTMARKTRSDKGLTVFNSDTKRRAVFTAFNTFKKRKTRSFRETTSRLSNDELKREYENLPRTEKDAYECLAARDRRRAAFIWGELKQLLIKTKGKVSYRTMANQLGDIMSPNTISAWLQNQEGFSVRRDRILPSLDLQAKARRVIWAHSFWMFWYSARLVNPEKAIFVLVHMDEKWFYAVRTRANCKILTSIGLKQADYRAHHKSHIGKEMYIVVTAYVLRDRNDITKGGTAVPVSLIRVGRMVKAKRNTYKRVYKEDGSYTYPKIEANLLRREGEEYFKSCELTGSKEGTSKKPKMSLLKVYQEQIIPDLEEKIVKVYNNNGTRKVVIVKQEDGAGLHQDKTYLSTMRDMFEERGWLLFNQPSQSPVTNVHDACVFPMMSKKVSAVQAIMFGSILLKGEQLYETVKGVWEDESNHVAMSRAFAGHHQIVLSIIHHKGDNQYLVEKGGLSFGIRTSYVPDHEGKGVIPVPIAPETEGETTQGEYLNERASRGLKYDLPKVNDLDQFRLDKYMIKRLYDLMDHENMPSDMKEVWDKIIQHADTDSDDEECEIDEDQNNGSTEESDDSSTYTIYSNETRSVASSFSSSSGE